LNESAQATLKDAQGRRDAAQEKFAETQRTEQALVQREQTIENMEAKLERQLADVDELQTQLLQEKSRLATVSETLKQAVG
jgi:phage terminase small subunit